MPDDSDPPRKFYQFKPKQFDAVNEHASQPPSPPDATSVPDPGPSELNQGRIDVRDLFKQANTAGPALSARKRQDANDVHALLAVNHARADSAGLNQVARTPRRASRRKRDYWLLMVVFNAFFGFVVFGPYRNPMTFVYGLAGIILVSLGLTWIMWFVMDDY